MKNFTLFIIFAATILLVHGCRVGSTENFRNLVSQPWELEEIVYADSSYRLPSPEGVTIVFSDSTTLTGRGPCNSYIGEYNTLGQSSISILIGVSTMAYCNDMEFEDRFFRTLEQASTYRADKNKLEIYNSESTMTMVFKPVNQ